MIFNVCMQHREFELYKVYIYDDPWLTLTYLQLGQIRSPMRLSRENRYSHLMETRAPNDQIDIIFTFLI